MKLKNNWQKNKIFYLITLVVIISGFIHIFSENIGKNPFAKKKLLDNPVQVCVDGDKRYYVFDSSETIAVTDNNNELQYYIQGGKEDETFSYAQALAAGDKGELYVLDNLYDEDGLTVTCERIIQFNAKGKRQQIIYEEERTAEEEAYIAELKVVNGSVCFAKVTEHGIFVYELEQGSAKEIAYADYDNTAYRISDVSFYMDGNTTKIAIAEKNGDVYLVEDNVSRCIYAAREQDTEKFYSIVSELAFNEAGRLYLCDVGLREVRYLEEDYQQLKNLISCGEYATLNSDLFAEEPIYTGLNASNGVVSVLAAEYIYDAESDEEIYSYALAGVTENGEKSFFYDTVEISLQERCLVMAVYIAIVILLIIFMYAFIRIIQFLRHAQLESNIKIQVIMILTALAVTLGVAYIIFQRCNSRFVEEAASNLCNIAYCIGEKIDSDSIKAIENPDSFYTDNYAQIDEDVQSILNSKVNQESNVYCVIYRVHNDVVCEAYRGDLIHTSMYPMAGRYQGSIEEQIAQENDYDVSYEFALSEGTYMYSLVPIYDEAGNNIAFIETGMDYSSFSYENNALYVKVLMLAVMAVIIIMLLISELLCGLVAVKARKRAGQQKKKYPPEVIRPISFLFFVIANISTAFLPIYGMELWNDSFPMPAELAAALPLSAELIFAAVAAFLCGFLVKKLGVKAICIIGGIMYAAGNLLSAFAGNLWILIGANAICGIGSGSLSLALNTWAASYEEEEQQNKGFIQINASYLAGLNCGTVIGSLIWENFGIKTVYFAGVAGAVILILIALFMIDKVKVNAETEEEKEAEGSLKDLVSAPVIRFFACISIPYLICTAFLEYFFPIQAETAGLSATHISMAFLLSGFISIYIGSSLAEPITKQLGTKKTMVLASFIYAAALLYFAMKPAIISCYVVIVLFAVADSFGLSAQSVYFSSMPQVKQAGQSKALGVNSTVESITSACGSLIFGAVLAMGTQKGMFLVMLVFLVLLTIFVVGERKNN